MRSSRDETRPSSAHWLTDVRADKDIHAIAIHPPMVYGGSGSWYATYIFEPALAASKTETKVFETIWQEGARLTTVHRDDLADLILRVAERVRGLVSEFLPLFPSLKCALSYAP
jgi:nucleoside-diphosphate-sugar epimerase